MEQKELNYENIDLNFDTFITNPKSPNDTPDLEFEMELELSNQTDTLDELTLEEPVTTVEQMQAIQKETANLFQGFVTSNKHLNYTGSFRIKGSYLIEYMDKVKFLDKDSNVNILIRDNFCYIYSLNVGISLSAVYNCEPVSDKEPLSYMFLSLQLGKLQKIITKDLPYNFYVDNDVVKVTTSSSERSWVRPSNSFEKETIELVTLFNDISNFTYDDILPNDLLKEVLGNLGSYLKLMDSGDRLISFDKSTSFIKANGYFVFRPFKTKHTYVFNEKVSTLIEKLCSNITAETFDVFITTLDDSKYMIVANNIILTYPINNAKAHFNTFSKISPTTIYSLNKADFKESLNDIDIYTKTDCAIIFDNNITLINKTAEGTSSSTVKVITAQQALNSVIDTPMKTYSFNHKKLKDIIGKLKDDTINIAETNTMEHLLISESNMKQFVILSIK